MTAFFRTIVASFVIAGLIAAARDAAVADEPAADAAPAPFQPGEISIGEPLRLPARPRSTPAAEPPAFAAPSSAPETPATVSPPVGNGWIGLTVDDKLVTGRLVVVDVAASGPADRAGIHLQDQLLAIDGVPLRSADQLAAALAAIVPGSTVKVAVGRGDRIDEVALEALARPSKPLARDWQKAEPSSPAVARELPPPTLAPATAAPSPAPRPFAAPRTPPASTPALAAPTQAPGPPPASASAAAGKGRTALGVRTMPVDQSVAERFNLTEQSGALVIGVVHDLPASKAGVPPGSVIVALDNQPVRSPNELTQIVARGPIGRPVTLQYILPGGEQRRAEVSLQSLEVPLERVLVGQEP
ncbi:MAG: PDZ domain-containing protein [Planctomycetia bacterium]